MATTTNYGWTTPDDTALVKDGAAAIRTLGSSVDTTTKALNPSTTLGDIEYRSATANTNTRLGIGTTGQVLAVSGGVPAWTTPAAAASGLTYITKQTAADVASLTFDSVFTSTYDNYFIVYTGVRSTSGATTADLYFQLRYAGPTTQTATYQYGLTGTNSASTAINVGATNQSQMILSRNLGNSSTRTQGKLFLEGLGDGSGGFVFGNGQNFDTWGEESLNYGFAQTTGRAYTGFIISTSSGNINGTFTVYGLAKS